MKKTLASLLAGAMLTTCLAGCSVGVGTYKIRLGEETATMSYSSDDFKFDEDEFVFTNYEDKKVTIQALDLSQYMTVVDSFGTDAVLYNGEIKNNKMSGYELLMNTGNDSTEYYSAILAVDTIDTGVLLESSDKDFLENVVSKTKFKGSKKTEHEAFEIDGTSDVPVVVAGEETQTTETTAAGTFAFPTGETFTSSEFTGELQSSNELSIYVLSGGSAEGVDNMLQLGKIYDGSTEDDVVAAYTQMFQTNSGETPVTDVRDEGTYITGMYKSAYAVTFITTAENGDIYFMNLSTKDSDKTTTIMNSLVDDFLASDLIYSGLEVMEPMLNTTPTETPDNTNAYKADTTTTNGNGLNYTVPAGYSLFFEGDYLDTYMKDNIEVTIHSFEDSTIIDFLNGKTSTYGTVYALTNYGSYNSASGNGLLMVVEGNDMDAYKYWISDTAGNVNITIVNNYQQMSLSQITDILADFNI